MKRDSIFLSRSVELIEEENISTILISNIFKGKLTVLHYFNEHQQFVHVFSRSNQTLKNQNFIVAVHIATGSTHNVDEFLGYFKWWTFEAKIFRGRW